MSKTAFIFPGQGSQYVGMGRELAENFPSARRIFEQADAALAFSLSDLCFNGPESELQLTANTQPAILTTSIAAYSIVCDLGFKPDYVAGHSLGEYSALVAGGALNFSDAVKLVRRRGEFMQHAVPNDIGAMAAILGIDKSEVEEACEAASNGQVCAPANFNTYTQIVIAGHKEAVERAVEECKNRGARRAVMLKVSAPFHCTLMMPAQQKMTELLASTHFDNLSFPVVNNVDAQLISSGDKLRDGLIRQISSPVQWVDSIITMLNNNTDTFIEIGPGKVLCGLIKGIAKESGKEVKLFNIEDLKSLDSFKSVS